jgi:hypothetical protein
MLHKTKYNSYFNMLSIGWNGGIHIAIVPELYLNVWLPKIKSK